MSGLINNSLNGSGTNIPDSAGRSFTSSFSGQSGAGSPVFHHTGLQSLHNMHAGFNVPNMQRNSTMNNIPSGGVQQPTGSLSSGRFSSNNLPVALSQLSHGSAHGISNRGGLNVVGNPGYSSGANGVGGPRITSSMGNIGRSIGAGGGLSVPGLASRLNLGTNSGSGSLSIQGQNRLMSGVLPQGSPQVMSMLGNSYPNAGGQHSQGHVQTVNNLSSMGMLNDVNTNDSSPFDLNDFPQLTSRPSSAGGPQGQLGSLRKQGLGVGPIAQQNQEFSIQNEDFPALPGFKGGSPDFSMDMHQKEQLHDNGLSMMQSSHFSLGRSSGFNLGGSFPSHRPQQQQQQHTSSVSSSGVSFTPGNNQDLLHLHGSEVFPSSHSSYHSQSSGPPGIGLRPLNTPSSVSGLSYDQLIQQYQQQQQQQNSSQFRLQQISPVSQPFKPSSAQSPPDRYGLLGLLGVIRMSDPDLTSLALGIDLTTLGLNLNSADNLHKTFGSPWSDEPAKGDPEFNIPQCYFAKQPPALHIGYFQKFTIETLFYIFYSMPKDEAQMFAANELSSRNWIYHKEHRMWFTRAPNSELLVKTATYERGSYHCFDPNSFEIVRKDNFVFHFDHMEKRPGLPQH